jgi:Protein of unknown function DUF262
MKYNVTIQTVAWLNGRRVDETLEISPKFQRRAVWMESERSQLVETICSQLPFPEVYIHHDTDPNTGKQRHIVVDGQQRITSILMFIDGKVNLPVNDTWKGQYFAELSEDQKRNFWDYLIVVRSLSQTNDAEIRDLFALLNTNTVALNDQELRNARFRGRFKQAAERFADNPLFGTVGLFTPRDIRRMLDVEFASELLMLVVEGVTNKKDLLDDLYMQFEEDFPREADFESDFNATMSLVRSLLVEDAQIAFRTKSNFYSIFGACLRYYRMSKRTSFKRTDAVAAAIDDILSSVRAGQLETKAATYAEYSEAVTRAASDKGRRQRREDILFDIINGAEGEP